ncbi:hypothetical protein M011DRAFT_527391 [Sporormia fimetaria CBS 119925]|uniref:Uncharacterized protein n=1 Tax=Sporormia fimetaria CBS 119925 TaxID=1340428 RepID=A0A6A6V5M9_9PLEO|nr:hypothetical protein M011DRAFT_527391 [Sporormia fimetaria CBS 119925]
MHEDFASSSTPRLSLHFTPGFSDSLHNIIDDMFGHPGISAFEFAGQESEKIEEARQSDTMAQKKKIEKLEELNLSGTHDTQLGNITTISSNGNDSNDTITALPPSPNPKFKSPFLNHTPRTFEVPALRPVKKFDFLKGHYHGSAGGKAVGRANSVSEAGSESDAAKGASRGVTSRSVSQGGFQRKTGSWSQYWHQEPPRDWSVEDVIRAVREAEGEHDAALSGRRGSQREGDDEEAEADTGGVGEDLTRTTTRTTHPVDPQAEVPLQTGEVQAKPYIRSSEEAEPASPARYRQVGLNTSNTSKRRRRQTPFKLSAPSSLKSRHSPLEPLVAHHRKASGCSLDGEGLGQRVPDTDVVDAEGEADLSSSTFQVIQEYLEHPHLIEPVASAVVEADAEANPLNRSSSNSTDLNAARSPPTYPVDNTPALPNRNPKRLTPLDVPLRPHSGTSDFTSAAQGQYTPYTPTSPPGGLHSNPPEPTQPLLLSKRRVTPGPPGLAGNSKIGRMAPPILGHTALTLTADLNDLSYYLKHTGPPSSSSSSQAGKRGRRRSARNGGGVKVGLRMFGSGTAHGRRGGKGGKVVKKKSRMARGSMEVSGSGGMARKRRSGDVGGGVRERYPTPSCAREVVTTSGARCLRIVIPSSDDEAAELDGGDGRGTRRSVVWTDEMLNPLAGPEVEKAIAGTGNEEDQGRVVISGRSTKREPKGVVPVPVEHHPLLTREEQTRARKLRDLRRMLESGVAKKGIVQEDTGAGASRDMDHEKKAGGETYLETKGSTAMAPALSSASTCTLASAEMEQRHSRSKMLLLQDRVMTLQRQNTELAEALARIVGYEFEDGDLDAGAVLRAYRQIKTGSGDSGYGFGGRRGRVFTQ